MNSREHYYQLFSRLAKWAADQGYKVKPNDKKDDSPVDLYITDHTGFCHEVILTPPAKTGENRMMAGFVAKDRRTGELLNRFVTEDLEPALGQEGKIERVELEGNGEKVIDKLAEMFADEVLRNRKKKKCCCPKCSDEQGKTVAQSVYEDADERGLVSGVAAFGMVSVGDKFFDEEGNFLIAIGAMKGGVQMEDRWNAIIIEPNKPDYFRGQLCKFDSVTLIKMLCIGNSTSKH